MAKARITAQTLDDDNNIIDEATGTFEMDDDMHVYANISNATNTVEGIGGRPNDRK